LYKDSALTACVFEQVAANNKGIQLVQELIQEYSLKVVQAYMHYIQVPAADVIVNIGDIVNAQE